MTMYLPNPDLGPTGFEPAEFIDVPAMADEVTRQHPTSGDSGDSEAVRAVTHDVHDQSAFIDDNNDP